MYRLNSFVSNRSTTCLQAGTSKTTEPICRVQVVPVVDLAIRLCSDGFPLPPSRFALPFLPVCIEVNTEVDLL
jgi:hypothetical protein